MDKTKSSRTKRNKVESTNNKANNVNPDQVEDKKPGEKSLNEKGNEKVHDESTEQSGSNKKNKTKDISLFNINEDKKINPGDKLLEAVPSTHKSNEKDQELSSNQSSKIKKKKKNKYIKFSLEDVDKKINNGDCVLEARTNAWKADSESRKTDFNKEPKSFEHQQNSRLKNQETPNHTFSSRRNDTKDTKNEDGNKSFCEDQNDSKNMKKSEKNYKQNKAHGRNNMDFPENKCETIIDNSEGTSIYKVEEIDSESRKPDLNKEPRSEHQNTTLKNQDSPDHKFSFSWNNKITNVDGNKSFCKDQKDSKNIHCEKDLKHHNLKQNRLHGRNKTDFPKNECGTIIDGSEGSAVKIKYQNLHSNESFGRKQNYNGNGSKHSNNEISDRDSIDNTNSKQNRVHSRKNHDLSEDEERQSVKIKNQNPSGNRSFGENPNYHKNGPKHSNRNSNKDLNPTQNTYGRNKSVRDEDLSKSTIEDGERVLEEIDEDIFILSKEYCLAHCVAEDLRMGAGIAVNFKNKFGGVGKLIDQDLKIGNVGIVKRKDQYVFYLITKKFSNGKPTMMTMENALRSLLRKMKELKLTKLAIPKIGCGLDRLDWSDVNLLINKIFSGSGIHITVCVPSKVLDSKPPPSRLKVLITPRNLWEMEAQTHIIIFICLEEVYKKNWTSDTVDKVDAKYPFKENLLKDVKNNKNLMSGDIRTYKVNSEVIICMFTTEKAYYSSLEDGFININKIKQFKFMAIQSGPIEFSKNFKHLSWIVLLFHSIMNNSELWLCGDPKQKHPTLYDQYCKDLYALNNNSSFSTFKRDS